MKSLSHYTHEAQEALRALIRAQLHHKEAISAWDITQMRNSLDVIAMEIPKEQLAAYQRKDAA